jgi:hypothetical protein
MLKTHKEFLHEPLEELNMTPLAAACYFEQTSLVHWLREQGARSDDPTTSMRSVIYSVYLKRISGPRKRALLDAVCWRATGEELGQAMCLAAQAGNISVLVDLLHRGANINTSNQLLGLGLERTPLMLALSHRQETMVRILIANGADPYWRDGEVVRPLILSESLNHILERLKSLGWKESFWQEERSPLVFALNMRDYTLVQELVDAGALPWRPLSTGVTPWLIGKALRDPILLEILNGSSYQPFLSLRESFHEGSYLQEKRGKEKVSESPA